MYIAKVSNFAKTTIIVKTTIIELCRMFNKYLQFMLYYKKHVLQIKNWHWDSHQKEIHKSCFFPIRRNMFVQINILLCKHFMTIYWTTLVHINAKLCFLWKCNIQI